MPSPQSLRESVRITPPGAGDCGDARDVFIKETIERLSSGMLDVRQGVQMLRIFGINTMNLARARERTANHWHEMASHRGRGSRRCRNLAEGPIVREG